MPVTTVRIKYHLFFPILLRAARQWACIDVMTSALQCTGTTVVLIVLIRRRRTFASWVILIGCAKTDEPITGNITGSFCIFLLANPAWPSYVVLHDRLAIRQHIKYRKQNTPIQWTKVAHILDQMLEDKSTQTTVRTYIKVTTHSPTHMYKALYQSISLLYFIFYFSQLS